MSETKNKKVKCLLCFYGWLIRKILALGKVVRKKDLRTNFYELPVKV